MSNSKSSRAGDGDGGSGGRKRNLPSWMSAKDDGSKCNEKETPRFSRILEGVVFALSGFVNPERATLRSQALEMGAEYRPDWGSDCTLLVCAYLNTPKFRQVEADNGTVVRKEWISECYNQRKLVEIDSYLMHAGKPWRKGNIPDDRNSGRKASPHGKSEKQVERGEHMLTASSSSKSRTANAAKDRFSLTKIKEWAIDDLNRTVSWLENQEEKPESSEIKQIAAEGIMICLQDAIDFLEQNQDVRQIAQQWNVIPRAIEELIKLVDAANDSSSITKDQICRQAKEFKHIYGAELSNQDDDSKAEKKRLRIDESGMSDGERANHAISGTGATGYDSDETIEMTEEEIDLAYNTVAASILQPVG
uniref:BRCT domain-containing protein n=1 Tax=Rhizophora mucronata TaxID=61149 RepID=A0A2P2QS66_RHIMU